MSEAMSSPTDWAKFYQQNLSGGDAAAATSSPSTAMFLSNNLSSPHGSAPPSSSSNLLLSRPSEGRVSKPTHARRRSRASRRTPTTLLTTDTTNFRAMVQQFTGGPNAPFASTPPPAQQGFGFGLGAAGNRSDPHHLHNNNPNRNPSSPSLMFSPGYRLQYQPQSQNQGYMISMSNVNNQGGAAAGEGFFQRLGGNNPRPQPQTTPPAEGLDGLLMEMNYVSSSSSSRLPPNSNENRGNGFMF